MQENIALDKILFLDIETVSQSSSYDEIDEAGQALWKKKSAFWLRSVESPEEADYAQIYHDKAAIYAEFSKIIVISVGFLSPISGGHRLRVKSFVSDDEKQLLTTFKTMLDQHYNMPGVHGLCGHNIREFDIPFICRRMTIHGIDLPGIMQVRGKKPWETKHLIDTLELWKFGDFKNFSSLDLLAYSLGIPSSKDDIDGSQVGDIYHVENDLQRIKIYCEKDVVTTTQVYLRLVGKEMVASDQIQIIE